MAVTGTTPSTGALTVAGGAGIAGALNAGGALGVTGAATVYNATDSTSKDTGALITHVTQKRHYPPC